MAILCSDLHLQARPPVARSTEPDWFAAMAYPLDQLRTMADKYDVPVVVAGDIFDRWNSPPAVINFALKHLPDCYAVPGQHDLPDHRYEDIERSAYWTLVEAGKVTNLEPGEPFVVSDGFVLHGFPWGHPVKPVGKDYSAPGWVDLAVVHAYIWKTGCSYPGAPATARLGAFRKKLEGYTAAVFGDNHKGFLVHGDPCPVLNAGGFMRRKVDEIEYEPKVGLLYSNGTIERVALETVGEKFIDLTQAAELVEKVLDMSEFIGGLRRLGGTDALDFVGALKRFLDDNGISESVRKIILEGE